jgi:bacillithiol biosynthesis cysteine-adding enzyme BshC
VQEASASVVTRTAVDLRQSSLVRRLAADYAFAYDRLAGFFAGAPTSPDAWRETIARAQGHPRDRRALVDLLAAQQARRGAPPAARAAVERLADPRAVAVVTGQQAGVFGGPLYTLLKSLTAMRLAERAAAEHGAPVVAVFWIDAEDHDWDEVATTTVLDADLQPHRLTVPAPAGAGEMPVASLRLDARSRETIDDLRRLLPPTEFTADLLAALERCYAPGVGMADAFGQWLEHCLGDRGLVVFDAADPAAKPLAAGVFRDELLHAGRTSALAGEAGAALEALGYHAQVDRMADHVALFHLEDGRHPIRRHGPLLVAGTAERTPEQLAAVATAHPERFSPNVLLRPIVQDTLFPTVCYVGGPSELAYLGQLRGVYEAFGVPMPIVHPRVTATLLDASSRRFMTRYGLEFEALQAQDEARLNRLLEAQLPPHVEAALQAATRAVEAQMAEVIQAMPAIDPTLEGAARSALGKMDHELRSLHHKVIHAAKKRDETLRRQFNRARAQAFPGGHLQEREVGFVYFLNRYGPALVDVLAAELPLDPGYHWILTV